MARVKVDKFAADIKLCLKECEEAINKCLQTYKATNAEVKSMTPEEEKAFLKEAFLFLYDEADHQWQFPDLMDAVAKSVAIPQGVDYLFKLAPPS